MFAIEYETGLSTVWGDIDMRKGRSAPGGGQIYGLLGGIFLLDVVQRSLNLRTIVKT